MYHPSTPTRNNNNNNNNSNKVKMDPATGIPIVTGTPLPPPVAPHNNNNNPTTYDAHGNTLLGQQQQQQQQRPTLHTATLLNGGRSSRVVLPTTTTAAEHEQMSLGNNPQTMRTLQDQGFTAGLAAALQINKRAFPLRIWIVDNSGSMNTADGHCLVETSSASAVRVVSCTRWKEMQQTVSYHVQMAALTQAPTVFRLLNDPGRIVGPQQFGILAQQQQEQQQQQQSAYDKETRIAHDVATATQVMNATSPSGVTPLIPHLHEIRQNILELQPQLRQQGSKVVLVLATDGLPTNERGISDNWVRQQFIDALRALEGLPVWIVVRLCTDEDEVVDFWNNLDNQLELSLEVLDDFMAEAQEIHAENPWLTYGLPLHRMREMGFYSKLFDLLDERPLGKDELRDFFCLLFGTDRMDGVPDPQADWSAFCDAIERLNRAEGKTWNPTTKRMDHWVDVRKLKRAFKKGWFW